MAISKYVVVALLSVLGAWIYPPVKSFLNVMGVRPFESRENIHGSETLFIPDTIGCEDLEYHAPSGMLYTACVGDIEIARGWNPGAQALERHDRPAFGHIVVIDPKTMKSQKLSFDNFDGPFATHGIGLYTPPADQDIVYIYAINHLPNPRWTPGSTSEEKAASQVELFIHTVGSTTARHIRSIAHPLLRTPNDILGISEHEFLVTNDHYYRDGRMRSVEMLLRGFVCWTDLVHVRFDEKDVDAAVVLDTVANNNGLGWGPDHQVIIGNAAGGHVLFASVPGTEEGNTSKSNNNNNNNNDNGTRTAMKVSHSVPMDAIVDNAAFFADPFAGSHGKDYSGYLMPGMSDGHNFVPSFKDPDFAAPMPGRVMYLPAIAGRDRDVRANRRRRRLIFRDDGSTLRGATTSALVAIDPALNGGKREGWLFVTSIIDSKVIATRIDFETALG
ncbi:serum paraoxonase/arylesterase family protein [Xylaria sp. CBS 124048]|nr:serum paraoxonase/arylesterase family protein [Xylaria sp. CBS 124048]